MKNIFLMLTFVFLSAGVQSCVTDGEVIVPNLPEDDDTYYEVYEQFTQSINAYKNFETKLNATVTLLSPSFLTSFKSRYEKIYDEPASYLTEAGNGIGFFVTAFSPGEAEVDFSDTHLWTIKLDRNGKKIGPSLVRQLNKKERWAPFFSEVNPWSREFLIVFDVTEDVEYKNLKLNLSSSIARVTATW